MIEEMLNLAVQENVITPDKAIQIRNIKGSNRHEFNKRHTVKEKTLDDKIAKAKEIGSKQTSILAKDKGKQI